MNLRAVRRLAIACALAFALPSRALAHAQPFSWVDLDADRTGLHGTVTAHVVDLAHEMRVPTPDSLLSERWLAAHASAVRAALAARLDLRLDGERLSPRFGEVTSVPEKHAVRATLALPALAGATLALHGPLFTWEAQHETYFNVRVDGVLRHQDLLDSSHPLSEWSTGGRRDLARVVLSFVREGVRHIFIGPDHILFIVGLLLLGGSLARLAKIVTSFTVAHTVTLVLATLRIVEPPSRVIEPLIALSIVVVGVENLLAWGRARDRRAWLAFGFGFVHGFGFASVLRELSLPPDALGAALASFNVGVEIGQLSIVLAVAPLLAALRSRRPSSAGPVLAWGSAAVIAAGGYWFVTRLFFGA